MARSADVTKKKDDLCVLEWQGPQNNCYMAKTKVQLAQCQKEVDKTLHLFQFQFTSLCIKKHSKDTEKSTKNCCILCVWGARWMRTGVGGDRLPHVCLFVLF